MSQKTVLFIDSRVACYETLIANLDAATQGTAEAITSSSMVAVINGVNTGTGKVVTDIGNGSSDWGQSVTVQADGKIVVAGSSDSSGLSDFAVVRYNADGTLDISFNGTGKLITDIGGSYDSGESVAVQADGKIVVVGSSRILSNYNFAVVRYNTDGSLDTSFNGTGKLETDIGRDVGTSVIVQADSKIVVAGEIFAGGSVGFAVVRYNSDGSLDTSFNGTGMLVTNIGSGSHDSGASITVQADGKIVVAGSSSNSGYVSGEFAVVRYNSDGSLDTSFNGTGKLITDIGSDSTDHGRSVTVQADGKIVVAGYSDSSSSGHGSEDFAVVRYNSDGSLDTSFNGTGKLVTDIASGSTDYGHSITVQVDGKIVVAGEIFAGGSVGFAVVRYNSDGSLDTSFNGTGKLITDIGSDSTDHGRSVTVQADGKIVVAGYSNSGGSYDFAVVRYNSDGTLDSTFGSTQVPNNFQGTPGDDTLVIPVGSAKVDAGAGIDTVLLPYFPGAFHLAQGQAGQAQGSFGKGHSLELSGVEYVQFGSSEFKTKMDLSDLTSGIAREQLGLLTDLYLAFFGRAPDVTGLEYWQRQLLDTDVKKAGQNKSLADMAREFAWSTEAQTLFPLDANNRDFVRIVYQNCFDRDPDQGGWDYWTNLLDSRGSADLAGRGAFVLTVIMGAYAPTSGPADRDLLTNKHNVAMYYVDQLSVKPQEGYDVSINTLLDKLTQDSATQAKAEKVIDYAFANPVTLTGVLSDAALFDSLWN